jgi:dCTP deaminase
MAVIRKSELFRRLELDVSDRQSLVITPLLQRKTILEDTSNPDAIDVRLGTHFLLPQMPPAPFYYPSRDLSRRSHVQVHVPLGRYLVVPAHQTVLGATLEFVKLPDDLCGEILTKSSIARTFIVIETAPWIHPAYRGCLTLEIANVSNTPLLLYPGRLIGQLIFLKLSGPKEKEHKLTGTYLAPVYPEAPIFKNPEEDLELIGISRAQIRVPRFKFLTTRKAASTRSKP